MDLDDLYRPKKPAGATLGEDLAPLSLEELEARCDQLAAERLRVEAEIARKKSVIAAAASLFKA